MYLNPSLLGWVILYEKEYKSSAKTIRGTYISAIYHIDQEKGFLNRFLEVCYAS